MQDPATVTFDSFWAWLTQHPNCIVRGGTPEAQLFDDDELHWNFIAEGAETMVVQVLRGKRLRGEILIDPVHISYVQGAVGEHEGEYVFELISESESAQVAMYFFVLSHGFDDDAPPTEGRVH